MRHGIKITSEVFLRQDLGHILEGLDKANGSLGDNSTRPAVILFRAGFRAALEALATVIDVEIPPAAVPMITIELEWWSEERRKELTGES